MPLQFSIFDQLPGAPPSGLALRDYQQAALSAISSYAEQGGRRGLVAMATGLGKTVIFSALPGSLGDRRMLVLAHREELLDQAAAKIQQANPALHVGIEQADRHAPPGSNVVVASVQTLSMGNGRRLQALDASRYGVVVVDEAHHATARTYVQCLAHFGLAPDLSDLAGYDDARSARREVKDRFEAFRASPSAPVLLGFTATPNRSDGGGLDAVFDEIVYSMDIRAGMESGWLCPIIGRRIKTASSLDAVHTRAGDYAEAELADAVDTPERNALAVAAYQEHAAGRQCLVFAVNVEHTRNLLAAFQAAGIPAGMVVGETAADSREEAVRAYKAGEIRALVNCMVLTEGFDAPETSCIIMARPTKSSLLYTQMLGRGTRLSPGNPGKNLLVLDLVDVARKAGAASLNTIFGLPPRYELGGSDVLAAKRATEEYEDAIPQGEFEGLENLDQVKRAAEEFDPLRSVGLPEWFAERTRLAWIKTAYGFALGVMGAGQLGIVVDMLGHCRIRLKQPRQRPELIGAAPDVLSALAEADAWVAQYAQRSPDGERLAHVMQRDARWRTDAASEKQIAFLKKLGARFPESISKGQASALIDAALGKK